MLASKSGTVSAHSTHERDKLSDTEGNIPNQILDTEGNIINEISDTEAIIPSILLETVWKELPSKSQSSSCFH